MTVLVLIDWGECAICVYLLSLALHQVSEAYDKQPLITDSNDSSSL